MNSNLLITRIKGIQIEYKELLSKLSPKLKSGQVPEALDELNLFWLRHIDEVQLYLKYWLYGEDCYIFTAATFMDFNDNEHLPFLLMGEKHILDDPLGRYSELCGKMERGTDSEFLYRQVIITSEDNLRILEGTDENILAFAVHQLCDKDKLASVGFERFLEKQQQYDFDKKLLHALSMHGINEENFENRIVPQIVTDELEKFYSTLLVSE